LLDPRTRERAWRTLQPGKKKSGAEGDVVVLFSSLWYTRRENKKVFKPILIYIRQNHHCNIFLLRSISKAQEFHAHTPYPTIIGYQEIFAWHMQWYLNF
jgi:hypothetical protein